MTALETLASLPQVKRLRVARDIIDTLSRRGFAIVSARHVIATDATAATIGALADARTTRRANSLASQFARQSPNEGPHSNA
jgi:hypothetical protein